MRMKHKLLFPARHLQQMQVIENGLAKLRPHGIVAAPVPVSRSKHSGTHIEMGRFWKHPGIAAPNRAIIQMAHIRSQVGMPLPPEMWNFRLNGDGEAAFAAQP